MQDTPAPPRAPRSNRLAPGWLIAFGLVVLLLLAGILYALLRNDRTDGLATDSTSTSTVTSISTSTSASASTSASTAPATSASTAGDRQLDCSAAALQAAVPADVLAADAQVADFACTPAALGDYAGGFAWARFESAGVDPLNVFFKAYVGEPFPGSPPFGQFSVITYGSAVVCEEQMPAQACALMPTAPN